MAENNNSTTRNLNQKMTFTLIAGLLYVIFGILQFIAITGVVEIPLVPPNTIGVMVLLVIGAVFLEGYRELSEGNSEGVAYVHVGIMLSIAFGILYLLVLGADTFSAYILELEDFEEWTIMDDMRPEFYLGFLSLAGYFMWKDDFHFTDSSVDHHDTHEERRSR